MPPIPNNHDRSTEDHLEAVQRASRQVQKWLQANGAKGGVATSKAGKRPSFTSETARVASQRRWQTHNDAKQAALPAKERVRKALATRLEARNNDFRQTEGSD